MESELPFARPTLVESLFELVDPVVLRLEPVGGVFDEPSLVEGDDAFNSGYNKGIRDAILEIYEDDIASRIHFDDEVISNRLVARLELMIVNQNVKGKKNGKEKA